MWFMIFRKNIAKFKAVKFLFVFELINIKRTINIAWDLWPRDGNWHSWTFSSLFLCILFDGWWPGKENSKAVCYSFVWRGRIQRFLLSLRHSLNSSLWRKLKDLFLFLMDMVKEYKERKKRRNGKHAHTFKRRFCTKQFQMPLYF